MPIIATRSPITTIGGNTCYWNAAHNDIFFRFYRSDFTVTAVTNSGGNASLTIGAGGVPALTVGGYVYVRFTAVYTSGLYEIVSNTAGAIVILLAYSATTTGACSLVTDYSSYVVICNYQYSDDGGSTWTDFSESEHQMNTSQELLLNISPYVKALVASTNEAAMTANVNDDVAGADRLINIVFTEEYYNVSDVLISQSAIADFEMTIVNAVNQIGYVNSENLKEFVTNATPSQTLKWPHDFVQPTYWKDYPFHLFFYFSELMTGSLQSNELEFIDSTQQSTNNYTIDSAKIGHVNRYRLQELGSDYNSATDTIRVKLKINAGADLSETITVRYNNCAVRRPVYIKWVGKRGAWNYWMFDVSQIESSDISAKQGEFSQFIEFLNLADTSGNFISKEETPEIQLFAEKLDYNDVTGLRTLLSSPKVMMMTNPTTWQSDGADKWQTVMVSTGRYKIRDTKGYLNSFQCTISLPEQLNISN